MYYNVNSAGSDTKVDIHLPVIELSAILNASWLSSLQRKGISKHNHSFPATAVPVDLILETILNAAVPDHDPQQVLFHHPLDQGVDVFRGSWPPATHQDAGARYIHLVGGFWKGDRKKDVLPWWENPPIVM